MSFWEFLTSATAPWWTGLAGVVIGAVFGLVGAWRSDRRRFEQENRVRYRAQLSELVARFLSAAHEMEEARPRAKSVGEARLEAGREVDKKFHQMWVLAAQIRVLTPPTGDLYDVASNYIDKSYMYCYDYALVLSQDGGSKKSLAMRSEMKDAEKQFVLASQKSLGVVGGQKGT